MNKSTPLSWATVFLTLVSLFSIDAAVANKENDVADADVKIVGMLEAINKLQSTGFDEKAFTTANDNLINYLKEAGQNPDLLTAKLRRASENGLGIATSTDKKMRIYSWDTNGGGTMHFFDSMAQYQVSGSDQTKVLMLHPEQKSTADHDDPDSGWYYSSIDPIHTNDGKTVYLAMGDGVFSTIDHGVCVEAYTIENGKLAKMPFFKTEKKLLNEIECYFHGADASDAIGLADKGTTLKIPLLKGEGVPTGKFLIYKFDGHRFVYKPGA